MLCQNSFVGAPHGVSRSLSRSAGLVNQTAKDLPALDLGGPPRQRRAAGPWPGSTPGAPGHSRPRAGRKPSPRWPPLASGWCGGGTASNVYFFLLSGVPGWAERASGPGRAGVGARLWRAVGCTASMRGRNRCRLGAGLARPRITLPRAVCGASATRPLGQWIGSGAAQHQRGCCPAAPPLHVPLLHREHPIRGLLPLSRR